MRPVRHIPLVVPVLHTLPRVPVPNWCLLVCRQLLTRHVVQHTGDAAVGKSSLLVRLTDQRFLANPDPTVRYLSLTVALLLIRFDSWV